MLEDFTFFGTLYLLIWMEVIKLKRLRTNIVEPVGPEDAPIWWVGEAPGEDEDRLLEPFVGDAGQFMGRVFAKKRIIRSNYRFDNIFEQRPPRNNIRYFYEDENCTRLTWEGREHLEKFRLRLHKAWLKKQRTGEGPNLIVALGRQSMLHLTGKKRIYKWRGSVLPCILVPGFKVYCTLHPSHVMRTMNEEKVKLQGQKKEMAQNALPLFEIDMDRIMVQKDFPELKWPQRVFDTGLSFWEIKEKLRKLIDDPKVRAVTVDIETLPSEEGPYLWCIGFSDRPDYAFTIPFVYTRTQSFAWSIDEEIELVRLISELFLRKDKLKVFQGGLYDLAVLGRYYGIRVAKGTYGDTMYCHHSSYPYLWKRLEVLASIYTWEPYYKDEGKVSLGSRTDEAEFKYNCKDCGVTQEIYPITVANAKELRTYEGYKRTMSILPVHLGMSLRGCRIDIEGKEKLSKEFKDKAEEYEKEVVKEAWEGININSNTQLNKFLYGLLGLELQLSKKTKKATSDKNALNKLKRRYKETKNGKIIEAILEYKKFSKLASTYTEMKLDADGRLRTSYSLTSTWRMNSSSSPFGGITKEEKEGGNLQNIPVRTEEGRMVRRLFIPDPGKVLLCFDRRQAEAMFVAWDSRDQTRIKMFLDGWDVHWYNAKLIFGIPLDMPYVKEALWRDAITKEEHTLKEYRDIGKTIVHAGNYGMGPYKLQEILALQGFIFEFKECKAFLEAHKARNPHLLQWQREIREEVRATRTLISPIGRKREFMGRMNAQLYNATYAFKPQNFVGELTEITLQKVDDEIGDKYELLINVHDEGVGQCYPEDLNWCMKEIRRISSYPVEIRGRVLDIPVDFKTGPNWADCKEVKEAA